MSSLPQIFFLSFQPFFFPSHIPCLCFAWHRYRIGLGTFFDRVMQNVKNSKMRIFVFYYFFYWIPQRLFPWQMSKLLQVVLNWSYATVADDEGGWQSPIVDILHLQSNKKVLENWNGRLYEFLSRNTLNLSKQLNLK